ncbi:MAG: AMP-binding protein [Rhodospirillales bacterium]|nr:AMP-binding protein [Rhodospirillales bacterium]
MLAGDILRRAAARFPDKIALIDGERRMTFGELDRAAARAAGALVGLGFVKGSHVAILAPNILEYPVIYYGAARAGVVLATISVRDTPSDLAYKLDKTDIDGLFFWHELAPTVAGAQQNTKRLRHLVAIGGDSAAVPDALRFEDFMARGTGLPPSVALSETDPLAISFTGGTTGFPKAVLVSHRARYTTAVTCTTEFGIDARDVALVATPLFHAAGLFVWLQPALMLGCSCVLQSGWDSARFIDLVERHKVSAALLVPTQLSDLITHPAFSPERLSSLRHLNYAASPMPVALYDRLIGLLPQVAFVENYGQSETGPMTVRRPFHPHEKRGSIGRPAHNVETTVFDPQGNEAPPGMIGEIVTRGAHLLTEYYGDPEQTAALFKTGDGWLWTGDLGVRDADGFISLVDRSKDMIVSGGENIYPVEIENALFRHPAVAECAAFGIPDDKWGEVPAAHVVLKPEAKATPEELIEFVGGVIARYKRPRLIVIVPRLPKTPVGKIQKNVIRDVYWRDRTRRI